MIKSCPLCQSDVNISLRKYNSTSQILSNTELTKCGQCELVFANPMPTQDAWTLYNSDYFNVAHGGIAIDLDAINFFKGMAVVRMKYILNYCKLNSIELNSILEIGPGVGHLAGKWIEFFPKISYTVVETDKSCHSSLKKLGVNVLNNIENIHESSSFDLVIHSHVLEHVINPVEFLEANTRYLRKGGVLFIDVPCNDWKFKELDEPHLLFFDKTTMLFLLNKMLNHKNIQISYHGNTIRKILQKNNFNLFRRIVNKFRLDKLYKRLNWVFFKDKKFLTISEYLMIFDLKPYLTNKKESWWLRSISIK